MREILFRGKRLDNGEWSYGFYNEFANRCTGEQEHFIQTVKKDGRIDYIRQVNPETVGQFTGLTDKNGTKIFEGDILRGSWNTVLTVFYDDIATSFKVKTLSAMEKEISYYGLDRIEVVGNIHDTPELVEDLERSGQNGR